MSSPGQVESNTDVNRVKNEGSGGGYKGNRRRNMMPAGQRARFRTTKFKGETTALQGHIFDVGITNQADLFTETTKKLSSYAGRTCKEPQDIRRAIEDIKKITITMPVECMGIADKKFRDKLYEKDIEIWSKR